MALTKRMVKKKTVREDRRPVKAMVKRPILPVGKQKSRWFQPGTKILLKIKRFQKSTHL